MNETILSTTGKVNPVALSVLWSKMNAYEPDRVQHYSLSDFAKNPLEYCDSFVKRHIEAKETGRQMFARLLKEVATKWKDAPKNSIVHGCKNLPDAPSWATLLPDADASGWDAVDWGFPDSAVASVMGVSRQAAQSRRNSRFGKYITPEDDAEANAIKRKLWRNSQLAEILLAPVSVIESISELNVGIAAQALDMLPDAPDKHMRLDKIREEENFGLYDYDAIQWVAALKGISYSDATRLLMTAFPNALELADNILEEGIGIPKGSLQKIRDIAEDWQERFKNISDVNYCNSESDPVSGLSISKGISKEMAAKMLWVAYCDQIK